MRLLLLSSVALIGLASCSKNKDVKQDPIANNKAVKWTKMYGGSEYDFANSVVQLTNGNYVVAGTTRSTDGDIGGSRYGYDTWMMSVDSLGNKLWSNVFGTNADEYTNALTVSPDGGFIVVGFSGFLIDTVPNYAFVIKTDATGHQVWRKDFNTINDSKATSVVATQDGNVVVAGYALGEGGRDGWAAKISPSGNIIWTRTFGGGERDYFNSVAASSDGGFVFAGYSLSSDRDVVVNKGNYDGWVLKVDAAGNKQWSKTYGGNNKDFLKSIVPTSDGGFITVGSTASSNGDISLQRGNLDEMVIKLDANGNRQWVKTFGGTNDEFVNGVIATPDGSYVTIGYSNSTNFDVNRTSGDFGGFLIKLDANGNKTASSTYGGNYDDGLDMLINTADGGYMVAGNSVLPSRGYDAWLVKIDKL